MAQGYTINNGVGIAINGAECKRIQQRGNDL